MRDRDDPLRLIYTTFATTEEAERCGRRLVELRLAACVNMFPAMISIYEWQGSLGRDLEVVMIVKTRLGALEAAVKELKHQHPYDTPAIIVIAPESVDGTFADWVRAQTS